MKKRVKMANFSININKDLLKKIEELSKRENRSRNNMIHQRSLKSGFGGFKLCFVKIPAGIWVSIIGGTKNNTVWRFRHYMPPF
jgi:hypothetical protein